MTTTFRTALVTDFGETGSLYGDPNDARLSFIDRTEGPTIVVGDEFREGLAEQAWVVGNRQARDAEGQAWPSNVRSLSVGDALIVEVEGREVVFVALPIGFRRLPVSGPALRRVSARSEQGERGPWADDSDVVEPGLTDPENYAAWVEAGSPASVSSF